MCNSQVGDFPREYVVDTKDMTDEQIKVAGGCGSLHHAAVLSRPISRVAWRGRFSPPH